MATIRRQASLRPTPRGPMAQESVTPKTPRKGDFFGSMAQEPVTQKTPAKGEFSDSTDEATTGLRVGDLIMLGSAILSIAFLMTVIAQDYGMIDLHSKDFMKDGFCVSNKDTPLLQSHILCFYGDTIAALILGYLGYRYRDMQGAAPVKMGALATFMHGLGHLGAWSDMQKEGWENDPVLQMAPAMRGDPLEKVIGGLIGLWFFFFLLLRSAPHMPQVDAAIHAAIQAPILYYYVPQRFGFTWVQTVLMVIPIFYMVFWNPKKDIFYDLNATVIVLPVAVMAWAEGGACDYGYKAIGGHFWYDTSIYVGMLVYYYLALGYQSKVEKSQAQELSKAKAA
uniref:Uncharacterized protein n=1 Tax=Phaeomonas parva TaxID=124430 RepID=A0A7S1U6C8_9STRA